MEQGASEVRVLAVDEAHAAARVLAGAFFDYPTMRFVLGDGTEDYGRRLEVLIGFFVTARFMRGGTTLGAGSAGNLRGTALISRSDGPPSPPELDSLRERVWLDLGAGARERYDAYATACGPFPEEPHLHLNMIGVSPGSQGTGVGRQLMKAVHQLSGQSPDTHGVTLTTEDPDNVALYEHFGYRVIGHARASDSLEVWSFFRPD